MHPLMSWMLRSLLHLIQCLAKAEPELDHNSCSALKGDLHWQLFTIPSYLSVELLTIPVGTDEIEVSDAEVPEQVQSSYKQSNVQEEMAREL